MRREHRGAVYRDFTHQYIVNQLGMRWDSVVRHGRNHVLSDRGIDAAGDQVEPKYSRRSIPTGHTVNKDVATRIANTFMDCVEASDCVAGRNSHQVFNWIPDETLEWAIGFRQLIGRLSNIDDVGDCAPPQFIEARARRESSLPDVASDAKQRIDPLLSSKTVEWANVGVHRKSTKDCSIHSRPTSSRWFTASFVDVFVVYDRSKSTTRHFSLKYKYSISLGPPSNCDPQMEVA